MGFLAKNYSIALIVIGVAGLCDFIENCFAYSVSDHLPMASNFSIQASSFFAIVKWSIAIPTALGLFYTLYSRVSKVEKKKKAN